MTGVRTPRTVLYMDTKPTEAQDATAELAALRAEIQRLLDEETTHAKGVKVIRAYKVAALLEGN